MKRSYKLLSMVLIFTLLFSQLTYAIEYRINESPIMEKETVTERSESERKGAIFFENKGLKDKTVEYYTDLLGGTIFYDKKGESTIILPLISEEANMWVFKESLIGSKKSNLRPDKSTKTTYNFMIGNDTSNFKKNVKGYTLLEYGQVYDNIAYHHEINSGSVEKIFTIQPGGRVDDIKVAVKGVDNLEITDQGEMKWHTKLGYIKLSKPIAYQKINGKIHNVEVSYRLESNTYGFEVGAYDETHVLIIDPTYIASYFGGGAPNSGGDAITTDKDGNIFITGRTFSASFQGLAGPHTSSGTYDVYVVKFDPKFETMEACYFLGGSGTLPEAGTAIRVSDDGSVYVGGYTGSSDFPMATTGHDHSQDKDITFILKFSNDLSQYLASTFIDKTRYLKGLEIDKNGDVIVAGSSKAYFVTTPGAYQSNLRLSYDHGFVSKYSSDLTSRIAATQLGGTSADYIDALALSSNGDIIVTGTTYSGSFPTSSGAHQTSIKGSYDGFVSILSNDLTDLKASTFIGSSGLDGVVGVTEDAEGNIYVIGNAASGLATTSGALYETSSVGKNAFIGKFNRNLSAEMITYYGVDAIGVAIGVNNSNEIIVSGYAKQNTIPLSADAFDSVYSNQEAYVSKLNSNLDTINYSTYFGGSQGDYVRDMYVSDNDMIYVTGNTNSNDIPTTQGVYQSSGLYNVPFIFILPPNLIGEGAAVRVSRIASESSVLDSKSYGAFTLNKELISIEGALGVSFSVNYNSIFDRETYLGKKWDVSFDTKAHGLGSTHPSFDMGSGIKKTFAFTDTGYEAVGENYHYDALTHDTLNQEYTLTSDHKVYKVFDKNTGLLKSEKTKDDKIVTYTHTGSRLDRITDDKSGRYIHINYEIVNNFERISSVIDNSGRAVSITYDSYNQIQTITDPEGYVTTFTYDASGRILTESIGKGGESYLLYTNTYNALGCLETVDDNNTTNQVVTYSYDTESKFNRIIVTRTNQLGYTTVSEYDLNYNLIAFKDEESNTSYISYENGKLSVVTDPLGNQMSYTYTVDGQLASVTNPEGYVRHFTYSVNNNLETVSSALEGTISYEYTSNNKIKRITQEITIMNPETYSGGTYGLNPQNSVVEYFYDVNGDLDYIVSPQGHVTDITLDASGQLKKVESKDSVGGNVSTSETYFYDNVGRINKVVDSLNTEYLVDYYNNNAIKKITNPLNQSMDYTYYPHGGVKTVSDYEGEVTTYFYDNNLNLIEIADPIIETPTDARTRYTYDGMNRVLTSIDRNNNVYTREYYNNGWLKRLTNGEGQYQRYEYLSNGLVQKVYEWDSVFLTEKIVEEYTYNKLGNVLTSKDALLNTITNVYDGLGRLNSSTDPENHMTQFEYDEMGRLVLSLDAALNSSRQVFDKEGRILYVQDQDDDFTDSSDYLYHYDYDVFGRLSTVNYGGIVKASLTYKNGSNLIETQANGRGQLTSYEYDALRRISRITDTINIRDYSYDPANNKITITTKELITENVISTIEYVYDSGGRITSYKNEAGDTILFTYYPEGQIKTMVYPGGKTVTYTYNHANQLSTVTDWHNNTTTYTYNNSGERVLTTRPNGTVESYTYYKNGWLKTKSDKDSSNNIISDFTYQYDKVGNIVTEVGNGVTITNTYDVLNELLLQQKLDDSQILMNHSAYDYDSVGNITTEYDENGVVSSMTYSDGNKLATFNGNNVIYDNDGNMTNGPFNGVMSAYTFNQRNQLISVGTLSANYDAQGRRTELTRNGQITKFTLNPLSSFNQVLISENYLGEKTYYVYGLGLISEEKNSEMSYYHFDFRGSTIALTDASELVTDTFEYDAYGKVMSHTGSSATMFKYVGQYGVTTDTDTLYFMMTRYYSPEMRRFISQDTVVGSIASVLSTNQFIYAVNNPIILIDFDGEKPKTLNPSYTPNSLTSQKGKGTKEQWQSIEWQDGVKEQYMFTASITAGFTPLDTAVDLATLVLGYDPITGDNVSRLAALGFLLVPEAIEASVKGLAKTVANSEGIIKGTGNAIKGGLETGIIAKNGIKIEGFTSHGVDRAIGDGMKRAGVKPEAILDAIKNPLKINDVVTDQFGRQSQRFIGETAEVVINPLTGKIVSINPTSSSKAAKLLKELGVQK